MHCHYMGLTLCIISWTSLMSMMMIIIIIIIIQHLYSAIMSYADTEEMVMMMMVTAGRSQKGGVRGRHPRRKLESQLENICYAVGWNFCPRKSCFFLRVPIENKCIKQ